MQNAELLNNYNKILRPYYSKLNTIGLTSIDTLDQYLEQFSNDDNLNEFLCQSFSQVKDLSDALDEQNKTVLFQYLKVRLFREALAGSVAYSILDTFTSLEIIRLGEAVRSYAKFNINNANDYFLHDNLIQILVLALAMKAQVKVADAKLRLPHIQKGVLVDFSSDFTTVNLLQEADTSYQHLYSFASNPHMLNSIIRNKNLRNLCAHHTIFKSVLHPTDGLRVYYDAYNNAFFNRLPANVAKDDFYLTRSIYTTVKETNADVIKFNLTSDFLSHILSSSGTKALNKYKFKVLACNIYNASQEKVSTKLDLNKAFADCFGLATLLKHMQSLKTPYNVELQFEAQQMDRLQLLFTN